MDMVEGGKNTNDLGFPDFFFCSSYSACTLASSYFQKYQLKCVSEMSFKSAFGSSYRTAASSALYSCRARQEVLRLDCKYQACREQQPSSIGHLLQVPPSAAAGGAGEGAASAGGEQAARLGGKWEKKILFPAVCLMQRSRWVDCNMPESLRCICYCLMKAKTGFDF